MRRFLLRKNPPIAVPAIIAINIGVFLAWSFADGYRALPEYMFNNFLVSWSALSEGRWWTLLTSAFSHNMFWHLLLNMYVLLGFGSIIEVSVGFKRFVPFYLVAGAAGSFTHAWVSEHLLGDPGLPALGASGAIAGTILLFALKYPRQGILLFGIVPIPAIVGAMLFMGLDLWGLWAQTGGGGLPIGHGAHLGGAVTGILFFLFFEWRKRRPVPPVFRGPEI